MTHCFPARGEKKALRVPQGQETSDTEYKTLGGTCAYRLLHPSKEDAAAAAQPGPSSPEPSPWLNLLCQCTPRGLKIHKT